MRTAATKAGVRLLLAAVVATLAACASVVERPQRPTLYDLGPLPEPAASEASGPAAVLVLPQLEAAGGLDGTAVLYRLDYGNRHELRPYSHARWSAPAAQLVNERLGAALARERIVIGAGQHAAAARSDEGAPRVLRLELQQFAHVFDDPARSRGELRLRATLLQSGPLGERLLAQRSFSVSRPAPSPDAAGGVQALSEAVDQAAGQIDAWLRQQRPSH